MPEDVYSQLFLRAVYARIMCGTPCTLIILIAGIQCCSLYVQTGYSSRAVFYSVLYTLYVSDGIVLDGIKGQGCFDCVHSVL